MKKTYIKPATAHCDMNTEAVIALSVQNGTEVTGNDGWEMLSRDEEDMDWDEEQGW